MSLSRRRFLESTALSTVGLALTKSALPGYADSKMLHSDPGSEPGESHRELIARLRLSFDQGWKFMRPDQNYSEITCIDHLPELSDIRWEEVVLPHSVRLEPRDVSGGLNYQGVCWYSKRFSVKPDWAGHILYLNFQGAMQVADLWLNGRHLMTHYGGYLPFTVDISKSIRFGGDNLLTVRLNNSDNPEVPPGKPERELDFVYFGGLSRSVQFEVLHPVHITNSILADKVGGGGVFVTYPLVSTAESTVRVQTDIANETNEQAGCTVAQYLIDAEGQVVASSELEVTIASRSAHTATQSLQVREAKLWHPDNPHLYVLHTTVRTKGVVVDDQLTRIGIRSLRFDKKLGLLLNGQQFFSIGANRHQDHPYVGYALSASAHYRDAYKLREAGFTSYRSHYPQDPAFMDACDELGILAIVSNPGWQFMGKDLFQRRVYQNAREMIRRDRNHPCVVLWEVALNETDNRPVAAELYRIVHEEYPGPECYSAGDALKHPVEDFHGWDVEYGRWVESDDTHVQGDPSKPWWIREWGDEVDNWSDQQGSVRVARVWGEIPMLVQATEHMRSLDKIYTNAHKPSGADLWAGIDAYRGYHHQPFLGAPLDLFRVPKFDYFMFQSQRSPELTPANIGSGPMIFIANFATLYSPSTLTVFSNCEQVRIYQNGKLIETRNPDSGYHVPHPPFSFKVGGYSKERSMLYSNGIAPSGTEIGEIKADGLIGGKVVATHLVQSPGVPHGIQLKLDTCGRDPIADGSDWIRVYAHICDARGTICPLADDFVTFSVTGQGALIGDEKIFANPLRAEAGVATALVRMTRLAGAVTVSASAPGLEESVLHFEARANPLPVLADS